VGVGESVQNVDEVRVPDNTQDPATLLAGQQILIGQEQQRQDQQRQEQGPEIPQEEITREEPRQRGPSVRERQRRDDLNPFERTFPTGGSAVADGTGTQSAQERAEQAQEQEATEPGETTTQSTGQPQIPGIATGQDTRQEVQTDQGQQLDQTPAQAPRLATGTTSVFGSPTATTPGFGTPTVNAPGFGEPTVTQTGDGPSRRRPPERPQLPSLSADNDEEERPRFTGVSGTVANEFRNPLTGEIIPTEDEGEE